MGDIGEVLVEQQQVCVGLPDITECRPTWVVEPRGDGRWPQASQRGLTQPGPHENAIFMDWVRPYPSANRNLALRRDMDAEASGVVDEAGVAGNDVVSLDATKAERIWSVSAPVLQRDSRSICGAVQRDPGVEGAPTQWLPANLFSGGQHVPTVAGVDSREAAAGWLVRAHGVILRSQIEGQSGGTAA